MISFITEVNQGRDRLDRFNYTNIVLISKVTTVEYVKDYRPIFFLDSTIKIISKVWVNRLVIRLPELVGENQTGFIERRSILDGIVVTPEITYQIKKERRKGFLLKLTLRRHMT